MAYNITLTAGEMFVVLDNGDTTAFNMTTAPSVKVERHREFNQAPATGVDPEPIAAAITITMNFGVMIRWNDGSQYEIIMGEVDNQPAWVNTQAGSNICVLAVQASFS